MIGGGAPASTVQIRLTEAGEESDMAPNWTKPEVAESYDKHPATHRAEVRTIRRLLGDRAPGASVLDVPCGNGRLTGLLAEYAPGPRMGADASAPMAREARAGLDLAVVANGARLPFPDDSVDLVVCVRLLHHLHDAEDRRRVLRELARVGRGSVLVSFYSSTTLQGLRRRYRPKRPSSRTGIRPAAFRRELAAAGLTVVESRSLLPLVREQTLVLCLAPSTGTIGAP